MKEPRPGRFTRTEAQAKRPVGTPEPGRPWLKSTICDAVPNEQRRLLFRVAADVTSTIEPDPARCALSPVGD